MGEETQHRDIRQIRPQVADRQGKETQNRQRDPERTPGPFEHQDQGEGSEHLVPKIRKAGPVNELVKIRNDVTGKGERDGGQGHFKVGNLLGIKYKSLFPDCPSFGDATISIY